MPELTPGFTLLTAPRLGPLAERLAATLAADPLPPTERETILVSQDSGIGRWLEVELAGRLGCAASLDVRSAVALATNIARRVVPGARLADGVPDPFERTALAWRLSERLDSLPDEPRYAVLHAYLGAAGASAALARRLATLFDDYQSFRPDVLAAWAEGAPTPGVEGWPHAAWQAGLWRSLTAPTEHGPPRTLDHAEAFRRLADRLEAAPPGALPLPRRISVFGARVMPPLALRVLAAAARHVPVTVYAVTPGLRADALEAVWNDDADPHPPFAHPLLRACGEHLRDYAALLAGIPTPARPAAFVAERLADSDLDGLADVLRDGGAMPGSTPALRQIQAALSADVLPEPVPLDPADRSIRVIDAHSPVRELEVLRDHLLDAFDTMPGLRPHDCLIVVPDLDLYAPLVDAVFVAEAAGGVRLPVHVVENPHAPARRVLEAFRKALRLRDGRLEASTLLDLLDAPAVRRRASIAETELPDVRAWLAEAGVRWGLDGSRKAALGLPDDDLHTWRFGLDRLLLGVACGQTDDLVLGRLPCDAAGGPGEDGADLLGRFAEWAHGLFDALARLAAPRPLGDWPDALVDFVDALFAPDADEEHEAAVFLRRQAAELAALVPDTDSDVPFEAVRTHLDGALGSFRPHETFISGRITVARPYALRHTPHRFVAFLGLDDGQVPGADTAAGYDLVAAEPRPGDAQPRRAEKQTFLDTLMAAEERLVLSFVGRSQKHGADRPASVVLDAFLDAADRHWGAGARSILVERHRLQPFHPAYFGHAAAPDVDSAAEDAGGDGAARPALFSYAAQHRLDASGEGVPMPFLPPRSEAVAPEPQPVVTLDELADAWSHPARYFMRRHLRASLDVDAHALDDDEPLVLGGLAHYGVRQGVLDGLLAGHAPDAIAARLRASGALPAGEPGAVGLQRAVDEATPIAEAALSFGPASPRSLTVTLGDRVVVGTADRVTDWAAVRVRPGHLRTQDLVAAWTEHLARAAGGDVSAAAGTPTVAIGRDKTVSFAALDAETARLLLSALVRGFDKIRERPPPLFDRASRAYAEAVSASERGALVEAIVQREREREQLAGQDLTRVDYGNHFGGLKKAQTAYYPPSWGPIPGDQEDPYVDLATRGDDPFDRPRDFVGWAQTLWAPLLHHSADGLPT